MSSRLRARQEGEAVAMKSVRKHQLMFALELKRLQMERLVSERYYVFERTLVQSRLNRLIARQKELGIYRPGSPLEKSMNLRKKNERRSFFLTSATLPAVKKGKQTLPQIHHHKQKINMEMNSLQDRLKQFNSFKKGETYKRIYGLEHVEQAPHVDRKTAAQRYLGSIQTVADSSYVVSNEGVSSSETQLQASLKPEIENRVQPENLSQRPSKGMEQYARKLPAIGNTRKNSNEMKTIKNLQNSKIFETETENKGEKLEGPQMIHSSAQENSQVQNLTSEAQEQLPQTQISRPANNIEELNSAMDKLAVKPDQNLKPEQPKRPRTVLEGYDEVSQVMNANLTTSIRAQSAH